MNGSGGKDRGDRSVGGWKLDRGDGGAGDTRGGFPKADSACYNSASYFLSSLSG